jgi:hypothetical protein
VLVIFGIELERASFGWELSVLHVRVGI